MPDDLMTLVIKRDEPMPLWAVGSFVVVTVDESMRFETPEEVEDRILYGNPHAAPPPGGVMTTGKGTLVWGVTRIVPFVKEERVKEKEQMLIFEFMTAYTELRKACTRGDLHIHLSVEGSRVDVGAEVSNGQV